MQTLNDYFLTCRLSALASAGSTFTTPPFGGKGRIIDIRSTIPGAIGGGDTTLTCKINGTSITNGAIVITESGSAAGDVDIAKPSAANDVGEGDYIEVANDGAATAVNMPVEVVFTIRR